MGLNLFKRFKSFKPFKPVGFNRVLVSRQLKRNYPKYGTTLRWFKRLKVLSSVKLTAADLIP